MPRRKLTETFLERDIKIPTSGQVDYFDTATTGFGIRVSYDGTKSFFAMGRLNGRKVRHTVTPSYNKGLKLEKARKKAKAALELMAEGKHPKEVEKAQAAEEAERRADTYGKTVEEFIDKFHKGKKKNRTWKESRRLLLWPRGGKPKEDDDNPFTVDVHDHLWMGRPVSDIAKREVVSLLDAIVSDGKGYNANRVFAAQSTFWKWCISRDRIEISPMEGVERPFDAESPRDRVFSESELKVLWATADQLDRTVCAFLKILMLTGKRRGAVLAMRWDELSDDWVWTPSADKQSRTKRAFKAPLPPLAQQVIKGLSAIKGNPYVFASTRKSGTHIDAGTPLQRKVRQESGIDDFLFHHIRHTVETKLAKGWDIDGETFRVPPHIRDLVLDHVPLRGSGAGYDHHDYADEISEALSSWANRLEDIAMPEGVRALR